MTKVQIRAQMRTRRAAVDAATRQAASRAVTEAVRTRPEFLQAREVACFLSLPQELETADLLAACFAAGKRVCVPAWNGAQRTYALVRLEPGQALAPGPHGVPEPADGKAVDPQNVDLAVVPGMAFDGRGGRLGYGKGYYDRILAGCRADCCKIGVAYAWQVVESGLPLDAHDIRMDLLVTEAGVRDCRPAPHAPAGDIRRRTC
jgi:5-formyltetrahydrofolate cyclo-ligase